MRVVAKYSHLNGEEWMLVHEKGILAEIHEAIAAVDAEQYRTKESKEANMKGKLLYSPTAINKAFKASFEERGWSESRTSYYVTDDYDLIRNTLHLESAEQKAEYEKHGKLPIFSYNQTDFVKSRVAVEVQLGKYSFIAYDLFVKHLAFFVGAQIEVGVEILPVKEMQAHMSSGPGYYESALYDLARQGRGVPAVPLVLYGVAP